MSNVASLELCKELEALSAWYGTDAMWCSVDGKHWYDTPAAAFAGAVCRAYDLGYLLRKLPEYVEVTSRKQKFVLQMLISTKDVRQGWQASYGYNLEALADSPEDAVALLAVKLLKSGVLPSEHETAKPKASPK